MPDTSYTASGNDLRKPVANTFTHVPTSLSLYRVPARILAATVSALREHSAGTREAVVLWQGRILTETQAEITKLHVPKQDTGPLHFNVPLRERLRILANVSAEDEFILVQLHTHPAEAFHSPVDDRLAITKHTGAISVVVPWFAHDWTGDFAETSVNYCIGGGRWAELSHADVIRLFEVVKH